MQARQGGFSLIEVIAVLLVLAIVTGLAGVRLHPGGGSDALQATAHELASRCRAARAGRPTRCASIGSPAVSASKPRPRAKSDLIESQGIPRGARI
jgi:prepilin-type N-terminal cleavage/methylation domain-containing protein